MSTDSTVAWGTDFERNWGEGDNRYFRKFWRNVVTWLAENSSGSNRRLELATDKVIYRPGQPILVTAKSYDEKLHPTDRYRLESRLLRSGKTGSNLAALVSTSPLAFRPEMSQFSGSMTVPSADTIRLASGASLQQATVEIVAYEGDRPIARSKLDVQILDDSDEYRDPRPDAARLVALARATGGRVLNGSDDMVTLLEQSTEAVDKIVTTRAPLWDSPRVLALVFTLLAAEWIIRRGKGLA